MEHGGARSSTMEMVPMHIKSIYQEKVHFLSLPGESENIYCQIPVIFRMVVCMSSPHAQE